MLPLVTQILYQYNYFIFFHLANSFQLKGYKVTDVTRIRKIGIACRNFQDLKQKACLKLNVSIY